MHRILVALTCVTVLVVAVLFMSGLNGRSSPVGGTTVHVVDAGIPIDTPFAPPGGCVTGCAVANHPVEPLTEADYSFLIEEFASGNDTERTRALESLLFHAAAVRRFMRTAGVPLLGEEEAAFLRSELAKTHVRLWLRIVDERGDVRAEIAGERFPIGERTHMAVHHTHALQEPEISGTIHRTGLNHLWTRM